MKHDYKPPSIKYPLPKQKEHAPIVNFAIGAAIAIVFVLVFLGFAG